MRVITKNRGMRFLLAASTAIVSSGLMSATGYAQDNGEQTRNSVLFEDEVIVTAQKKSENVQNVGIAITALTGDQLEKLGIENSTEIAKFTPSVSISGSFAGQQQQYVIRGVTQNDFNDHVESPNAVYIDEGYVAAQQGSVFATFDVERVEVLKGPQGTLFGRNATGGLVHYLTRKPTDVFEGYVEARYGSYDHIRLEGAAGGPISDKARFRIAGMYNTHEGYLKNEYPQNTFTPVGVALNDGPQLPGAGADLGGDETWALRGHLEFDTSDSSTLLLSANYTETTTSVGPYQSAPSIAVLNAAGGHINTLRPDANETREIIGAGGVAVDSLFDGDSDGVRPLAVLDNTAAVDGMGHAGLKDKVDRHTWGLFKGAALSSLLGIGAELATDNDDRIVRALQSSGQETLNQAGQRIVDKSLNIAPTITVRPGWRFSVLVGRDLILKPYNPNQP